MQQAALPSKDATYYDNTMLSSYKECPRRYFLRHVLTWRSEGTALPLVFGLAWHSAMDVVWQYFGKLSNRDLAGAGAAKFLETWEAEGLPADLSVEQTEQYNPRTPSVALEMLIKYIDKRLDILTNATLLSCEQPFAVPLPGTENTWVIGRLDKVIQYNGQLLVLEHKTTTEYKKDGGFKTAYVEGWYTDSQIKGYQFGGALFFPGLTQVWVDAALVHKTVHDAFRLIPVAHQIPLLQEWVEDTREWVWRIQQDQAKYDAAGGLGPGVFPKNEQSCMGKFGPCPFLNICRTTSRPDKLDSVPQGYKEERWEPFSILGLDKLTTQGDTNEQKDKYSGNTTNQAAST